MQTVISLSKAIFQKRICLEVYVFPLTVKITLQFLKNMSIGELIGELIYNSGLVQTVISLSQCYILKRICSEICVPFELKITLQF